MSVRSYEQIKEYFLADMTVACTEYRDGVGPVQRVAFGQMVAIRMAAASCLVAGTQDPLYKQLDEMLKEVCPGCSL